MHGIVDNQEHGHLYAHALLGIVRGQRAATQMRHAAGLVDQRDRHEGGEPNELTFGENCLLTGRQTDRKTDRMVHTHHRPSDKALHNTCKVQVSYLRVTLEKLAYGMVAQHNYQHQPNKVEQHPKEVQVEVLYVLLQSHLIVNRSQAGDGDAA